MSKLSIRDVARANRISHTKLYDTAKIRRIATDRGLWDEVQSRVMGGEKQSSVLADLMPDVLEHRKIRQQINQYRSTARWLLKNGFEAEDLIAFIEDQL